MTKPLVTATALARFASLVLTAQPAAAPAVFTAAQAVAGRTAYESSCAKCHTDTLNGRDGTGEIPEFLRDYAGKIPPLAGANSAFTPFLTKWGTKTTRALSSRVKEAVGGFPPKGLDESTYLNLTAYILQVNGARPGTQALTADTAVEIRSITTSAGAGAAARVR